MAEESSVLCAMVSSSVQSYQRGKAHARESRATAFTSVPTFLTLQLKILKRKGVLLVFLWCISFNCVIQSLVATAALSNVIPVIGFSFLFSPLFGWLADVHFSRYRVIKWCLRIMWLVSVLLCLMSLLIYYYRIPDNNSIHKVLKYTLYFFLTVGLGGLQTNIIQFGVDQLIDASSSEISSFFNWYAWLWLFSEVLVVLSNYCFCKDHLKSIPLLFLSLILTIAVSMDYIFNNCLVKEPPSSNPFTLIIKVLKYAAKNKYPRLRSAFTYWDDKHISRIDLGKNKYGGPFTTEEVEDVKTFWRIFGVIVVGCIFAGMFICTYPASYRIFSHTLGGGDGHMCGNSFKYCLQESFYKNFGHISSAAFLLFFQVIVYPLSMKYFHVSILTKCLLGIIMLLLSLIGYLSIEVIGRHLALDEANYDILTCPKDGNHVSITLPVSQKWTILPSVFDGIGQYLCFLGITEFICAQSPYSMKGLMYGLGYVCYGLFSVLSYVLLLLVQYAIEKWASPHYGCEMWYLLFIFLFLLLMFIICCCAHRLYKKRFRDDDLPNNQMFATQYYSQGRD